LSAGAGTHEGNFAPKGGAFVDKQSARMEPTTLKLCARRRSAASSGRRRRWNHIACAPEQITVKAHDGTKLYATLLLPEGAKGARASR